MIQAIAEKIIAKSICCGYIKEEQAEEYIYGLTLIGNIMIADLSTLIIGLCFGMIWECILFWLFYKILRKYCGGYHFNTSLKCYISSVVLCIGVLCVIKYVSFPTYFKDYLISLSTIVLLIYVPVEAVNKPLDEKEFSLYRKVAIILVTMLLILYVIARFSKWQMISDIIPLSVAAETIFVIAGKLNKVYRNKLQPA